MVQNQALDLPEKMELGITSVQQCTRFQERTTVSDAQQKLCRICLHRWKTDALLP